jgi:O-6-methylguanine DNA methyltransferase
MQTFAERVREVVRKIPKGETMTYRQVAVAAGSPRAYRGVGNILNKNYDPAIPCHRVVRSDGRAGGYNRGAAEKLRRLRVEGVGRLC